MSTDPTLPEHPAPTPEDLNQALDGAPEGPNIEAGPFEVEAARGETPLEGPRTTDTDDQGERLTAEAALRQASGG